MLTVLHVDLAEYTGTNEKLSLGKTANRIAARRLKNELVEMIDDVWVALVDIMRYWKVLMESQSHRENQDLDDEDEREWATAQAARANPYKIPDATNQVARKSIYTPAIGMSDSILVSHYEFHYWCLSRSALAPTARPLPTISAASSRLQSALQGMEISSRDRIRQIGTIERDLTGYDVQERELRQEVALVEAKKEWMEEFRGWIEALGGFLEEKVSVSDCGMRFVYWFFFLFFFSQSSRC
jgi:GC-rich sequence DNA-binding factor